LAMPWKIFMAFNVLGALLWTGVWGLGAYFLDKEITPVHRVFGQIEPFVVALTLGGLLTLMVYLFRRRRSS
jgi:membrane protein DedA with SNARE-associated domain